MSKQTIAEYRRTVGKRIRQARIMAGFDTIVSLSEHFPDWSDSRLGNYETGTSMPNPIDVGRIATATHTSPCWLMFGIGTIRSETRDIQTIRHQNFTQVFNTLSRAEKISLRNHLKLKPKQLTHHLKNPFLTLTATLCHKVERYTGKPKGWMDEQHIDSDGLCDFFSDDLRELLTIYSDLDSNGRAMLLEIARTVKRYR